MARENTVVMTGYISSDPIIRKDFASDTFVSGRLRILTVRRSFATDDMLLKGAPRWDEQIIYSNTSKVIESMCNLEKGDFVQIKGNLHTKETKKRYICPECNYQYSKDGSVVVYINPISVIKVTNESTKYLKLFRNITEERMLVLQNYIENGIEPGENEANAVFNEMILLSNNNQKMNEDNIGTLELREFANDLFVRLSDYSNALKEADNIERFYELFVKDFKRVMHFVRSIVRQYSELSNMVIIDGTLCREPEYYTNPDTRKEECDFQIACNRIRRVIEDGPDKKTDYPWVKTFGPKTKEYSEVLHVNSSITINGAIQTREIEQTIFCPNCHTFYVRPGVSMEIVPYHIEYRDNCELPSVEEAVEEE